MVVKRGRGSMEGTGMYALWVLVDALGESRKS